MIDSNTNVGIEKKNYQPCKLRMSNLLIIKGLWGYVIGKDKGQELPLEGATRDDPKAWRTWNERYKKVMFLILQNVSNGMIGHV